MTVKNPATTEAKTGARPVVDRYPPEPAPRPEVFKLDDFPRLAGLREELISARKTICAERPRLITEFYRNEGFDRVKPVLRQARALRYVLERIPAVVFENELIVGSTTRFRYGTPVYPEFMSLALWPELPIIADRNFDPVDITEEEIDILAEEVFPFWKDLTIIEDVRRKNNDPEFLRLMERFVFFILTKANGITHLIPDYPTLVNRGLVTLIDEAADREKRAGDAEAAEFYRAVRTALEGVITFAGRYAAECEAEAERLEAGLAVGREAVPEAEGIEAGLVVGREAVPETEGVDAGRIGRRGAPAEKAESRRAAELREIAAILRRVPSGPAETLHEALQSIWITQVALHQENSNMALSFGRLDQILHPLYERDLAEGRLDRRRAAELVGCFFIKMGDHAPIAPSMSHEILGGASTNQAVTLGGMNPDGSDAVSGMTYLLLDVSTMLAMREPNICARLHRGSPPGYRRALVESIYRSGAAPALYGDERIIEALTAHGVSREDAIDYGVVGCVEILSACRTMGMTGAIMFNLAAVLELTLFGGVHPLSGLRIGPDTGGLSTFERYEDFYNAFRKQLAFLADLAAEGNARFADAHAELHPTPLLSALIRGTMESGRDVTRGGASINSSGVGVIGLADVTDSLAALKDRVFGKGVVTPAELEAALKADFEGHEKTFAILTRKSPKYGSDDPAADEVAVRLVKTVSSVFRKYRSPRGGRYQVGYWSVTFHTGLGAKIGALPNGRRKGAPLASGATPVSGAAVNGPTASFASTRRLPARFMANCIANNHKISRSLLGEPGRLDIFQRLVDGYFSGGGMQVQFTVQDRETLLAAQRNPELHRDLLVRVSGYSAYFCDLNRGMQDEIIARTEDAPARAGRQ